MRTLHLTNPLMHGNDVRAAQTLLNKHGYLAASDIDGYFGDHSAHSSELAKFKLGYASIDIKPTYGDMLNSFLKGTKKLPAEYVQRQKTRAGVSYLTFQHLAMRAKVVGVAHWGVNNTGAIHYEQRRPIDGVNHPYQLPLYTDCSGFVTLCYKWADAPDPNGRNFDGEGYTGTLLAHMHPIMKSQVQLADIAVWGKYPGHHTAIVVETGLDPLMVSHGEEGDPKFIRFSEESRYQSSYVTWLTMPAWR